MSSACRDPGGLLDSQVAREVGPSRHSPRFIQQFARPPAVFRRRSNGDDVACLEVELGA